MHTCKARREEKTLSSLLTLLPLQDTLLRISIFMASLLEQLGEIMVVRRCEEGRVDSV